jgi:hypothetical protein
MHKTTPLNRRKPEAGAHMMKSIKRHPGWIFAGLFLGLAILAYACADSWFVKRVDSISTILLALLTAAYVVFTYQILKSTRPQPNVFASLPADEIEIHLSIKNIGNRPAYDVQVSFDPSLDTLAPTGAFKGAAGPMLRQPFMPPESEVRNFVSSTIKVLSDKSAPKKFKVGIRYKDSEDRPYSDSYEIDLETYVFDKKFLQYDVKHYLRTVSETLEKINESIVKLRQ